jgi:hypothetical protein
VMEGAGSPWPAIKRQRVFSIIRDEGHVINL